MLIHCDVYSMYGVTGFNTRNTITVLPWVVVLTFISFQQFFIMVTKWDRHLLVEDSYTVYNVMVVMNSDGSWWCTKHYTVRLILLQCTLPWPLNMINQWSFYCCLPVTTLEQLIYGPVLYNIASLTYHDQRLLIKVNI